MTVSEHVRDHIRDHIPWAEPRYWGEEEAFVREALHSSWISGGPFVERLEREFAAYAGAPHVVATSNGTTAIHAGLLALGLAAGEEIIVPGFAFMAAANIALHMGARPVFADIDPATWCLTADTVAPLITERTVGIVPVHSYGNMCPMDGLMELAAERGIWVFEDAAEAIGSRYHGQMAGTIAEIGSYSFHATKTITTGEGGGVATRSAALAAQMRLYRSHGVAARRYWHEVAGHNFRLTNMQAAIGCAQLAHIEAICAERQRVYAAYRAALDGQAGLALQQVTPGCDPVIWAVAVMIDPAHFPISRDALIERLAARGIECRPGFYSAAEMSHLYGPADTPVARDTARRVLSLPSSPTVSTHEIAYICDSLLAERARA